MESCIRKICKKYSLETVSFIFFFFSVLCIVASIVCTNIDNNIYEYYTSCHGKATISHDIFFLFVSLQILTVVLSFHRKEGGFVGVDKNVERKSSNANLNDVNMNGYLTKSSAKRSKRKELYFSDRDEDEADHKVIVDEKRVGSDTGEGGKDKSSDRRKTEGVYTTLGKKTQGFAEESLIDIIFDDDNDSATCVTEKSSDKSHQYVELGRSDYAYVNNSAEHLQINFNAEDRKKRKMTSNEDEEVYDMNVYAPTQFGKGEEAINFSAISHVDTAERSTAHSESSVATGCKPHGLCWNSLWMFLYYTIYFLGFHASLLAWRIYGNNERNLQTIKTCQHMNTKNFDEDELPLIRSSISDFTYIEVFISNSAAILTLRKYKSPFFIYNYVRALLFKNCFSSKCSIKVLQTILQLCIYITAIVKVTFCWICGYGTPMQIVSGLLLAFSTLGVISVLTRVLQVDELKPAAIMLEFHWLWSSVSLFIIWLCGFLFYLSVYGIGWSYYLISHISCWLFFVLLTFIKFDSIFSVVYESEDVCYSMRESDYYGRSAKGFTDEGLETEGFSMLNNRNLRYSNKFKQISSDNNLRM